MEVMYVKYIKGKRHSIIKEGKDIVIDNLEIIPFNSMEKEKSIEYATNSKIKEFDSNYSLDNKINDEITNFFFNAIHKNYLSARKNSSKKL
ncbi:hypothetical protein GKZ28_12005 [Clostridium chromiireducens]|uniref:Uncharacterized protein n=1 Tax=Clostridium chromiireducens TaxID=225345 RepID=A0A964RMI0_9CLOT|nr:hypothetical protein [Clostridium chromiireducens]MVX64414.1 hypothetical protein [Clostridium chromiireducens]